MPCNSGTKNSAAGCFWAQLYGVIPRYHRNDKRAYFWAGAYCLDLGYQKLPEGAEAVTAPSGIDSESLELLYSSSERL